MYQVIQSDQRTVKVNEGAICLNCQKPAEVMHHLVPYVRGGRTLVSLCIACHGFVHDHEFALTHRELIREGQRRGRALGRKPGRKSRFTKEMQDSIIQDRLQGMSLRSLSAKHSACSSSITKILRSHFKGTTGPMSKAPNGRKVLRYSKMLYRRNKAKTVRTLANWRVVKWGWNRTVIGTLNGRHKRITVTKSMDFDEANKRLETAYYIYRGETNETQ